MESDNDESTDVDRRAVLKSLGRDSGPTEHDGEQSADQSTNRRNILGGLLGSAATALGFTGSAGARRTADPAAETVSAEEVRAVLSKHERIVSTLHDAGLIETPEQSELVPDEKRSGRGGGGDVTRAYATTYEVGDEDVAFVKITKPRPSGDLVLKLSRDGTQAYLDTPEPFEDGEFVDGFTEAAESSTERRVSAQADGEWKAGEIDPDESPYGWRFHECNWDDGTVIDGVFPYSYQRANAAQSIVDWGLCAQTACGNDNICNESPCVSTKSEITVFSDPDSDMDAIGYLYGCCCSVASGWSPCSIANCCSKGPICG